MPEGESIGALYFDVKVFKQDIDGLLKDLDAMRAQAQARIDKNKIKLDVEVGKGFATADKAASNLSQGLASSAKVARPLNEEFKRLQGGLSILRDKLEIGEIAEFEFRTETKKVAAEMRAALKGTQDFSSEQVKLYRSLGQAERGLKSVAGEASRFGIAQQATIAINRQVLGQFESFGPLGRTASLGIDAMGGAFGAVPIAATAAAGAIGGVVVATGALVQKGKPLLAEYQRAMQILAQSGEENLGRFKDELTELQEEGGRAAQAFSRAQLAGALGETVKAGVSAADAMTLLQTGTKLAAAENQDLSDSTALVLQNLRQFNLGVTDAARAGDALAAAGNVAAGSAADLSNGLSTVGPVAAAAGLSLEETLGLLVALDNKGLSAAEEGATGLRSVLSALADPTAEARTVFQELGIALTDIEGNARPAGDVLADLKTALNGSETAMASAAKIFDTQGITTILALDETTEQYTQTILDSSGALESYADNLTNTADAAEQRAKVALDDLATTAAEFFAPAIAASAEALTGLLRGLDTFFTRITGNTTPVDDLSLKFAAVRDVVGSAGDKKTLAGVLDTLSTQLTGTSKTAFVELAEEVRKGKGDLEDFRDAAQNLIDEAKLSAEIAKVQTELSALESREVAISFSTDLNNIDATIKEVEARINASPAVQDMGIQLELGLKTNDDGSQFVTILNGIETVAGETSIEIAALNTQVQGMLAQGSEGSALTEEQANLQTELEGTRDRLSGLEGELSTLRASYADTGAAAAAAVREARDEVERTINEVDFGGYTNDLFINLSIKDPAKLKAEIKTLIESTKLEIQTTDDPAARAQAQERLEGYRQALAAANDLVVAERNLVTVRKQVPKVPPAVTPEEKGDVEDTNNALSGRVDIINRATTANRALAKVSTEVLISQKQLQDSLLAVTGRDITLAATAIGPNYDLAESAKLAAKEQRQLQADMREAANQASLTTRENAALDAVLKQLAKDIGQEAYREASNRLDLQGEAARVAAIAHQDLLDAVVAGKDEQIQLANNLDLTSEQVTAQAEAYRQVQTGLREAAANYVLTGDATQQAADQAATYQQAIDTLISAGFDPLSAAVQEYQRKLIALSKEEVTIPIPDVSVDLAVGFETSEEAAERLKNRTDVLSSSLDTAVGLVGDLAGSFLDADSAAGIFADSALDALGSLLTLDFQGFFSAIAKGISDLLTHQQDELRQLSEAFDEIGEKAKEFAKLGPNGSIEFDEAAYDEYLQYLEAIDTYGKDIADKFATIDENGHVAFDEAGLETFAQGLERINDVAASVVDRMREAKDATDSVLDAELSARQDTLDAKVDSQDGGYSLADIIEQQSLDIGLAAKARDEAYTQAAELEAKGLKDQADRLRAAADQSYAAQVDSINSGAEDRAEAIGKNTEEFRNQLDQNAQTEGAKWTEYWNQDAAAQIEAQRLANQEIRRQQAIMNNEKYQAYLDAGYSEQLAYEMAAADLGYQIDATTGYLVTAEEAAGQQQAQAITASGSFVSGAIQAAFGGAEATFAGQGSALSSTISSLYNQITGTAVEGSNLFGTTLTNGANLNLGTITTVGNLLGQQLITSGDAVAGAQAAAANQYIKQSKEAAQKQAQNEVIFGNEFNRTVVSVSKGKVEQILAAGKFQAGVIAYSGNSLVKQIKGFNEAVANAYNGVYGTISSNPFAQSFLSSRLATKTIKGVFNASADFAEVVDPGKYSEQQAKKAKAAQDAIDKLDKKGSSGSKGSGSKGGKSTTEQKKDEIKKNLEEVQKAIADTQADIDKFQNDTFDLIRGSDLFNVNKGGLVGGLLKQLLGSKVDFKNGLTEAQQAVLEFASGIGKSLETGVAGGISSGIRDAMKSGELLDLSKVMDSLFDTTFDGLFKQVSDSLMQKALGPLLAQLTADVTEGDVLGSSQGLQQIMARLPAVAAQIQAILAPLSATLPPTAGAINSTRTGGITLEQRSLGSASPTWVDTLGTTLSRVADRMYLAGERQYAAAVKLEAAATRAQTNAYQDMAKNGKTNKF